ncbi:hypothetical protein Hanom_Chr02g00127401 [Helianthus anomalus]
MQPFTTIFPLKIPNSQTLILNPPPSSSCLRRITTATTPPPQRRRCGGWCRVTDRARAGRRERKRGETKRW